MRKKDLVEAVAWLVVAAVLVFSVNAMAQTPLDEYYSNGGNADRATETRCLYLGNLYELAAELRESRLSPQEAVDHLSDYQTQVGFSRQLLVSVINQVYFDRHFAHAYGQVLSDQMMVACMDPKGEHRAPAYTPAQ